MLFGRSELTGNNALIKSDLRKNIQQLRNEFIQQRSINNAMYVLDVVKDDLDALHSSTVRPAGDKLIRLRLQSIRSSGHEYGDSS